MHFPINLCIPAFGLLMFCLSAEALSVTYDFKPLIGGPKFLPIHVACVVREGSASVAVDFIPYEATRSETIVQLITLRRVRGVVRIAPVAVATTDAIATATSPNAAASTADVERLNRFTERLREGEREKQQNMHLLLNNCYSFANRVRIAVQEERAKEQERLVMMPKGENDMQHGGKD